jgi:hypothetical protein
MEKIQLTGNGEKLSHKPNIRETSSQQMVLLSLTQTIYSKSTE